MLLLRSDHFNHVHYYICKWIERLHNAIEAIFGDATNYFTFSGSLSSNNPDTPGNRTITLTSVSRNGTVYGNREAFHLVIPKSKAVTSKSITMTNYTINLVNNSSSRFSFGSINYPVILTLSGSAPANCSYMFGGCSGLIEADLSDFDTSNVTNMRYMFANCTNLKVLKVKNDFPENSNITDTNMANMFNGRRSDNTNGKIIIRSPDGTFNSRFENFIETSTYNNVSYKDIVSFSRINFAMEIGAGKTSIFDQNTDITFNEDTWILLRNGSVLKNVTTIGDPNASGRIHFMLDHNATSATIKNIFAVQHDNDFDEDENVYGIKRGAIAGNYTSIDVNGNSTDNISVLDGSNVHLEDLTRLTENDTVVFAVHEGEFLDQNTVVIGNESDEPAEIATNLSNDVNKDGYTATNVELQGNLIKLSGDNSGFVNGKATASGAKVEFAGNKSMFQVPFELTDNSQVRVLNTTNYEQNVTIRKGSQFVVKDKLALFGEIHAYGSDN